MIHASYSVDMTSSLYIYEGLMPNILIYPCTVVDKKVPKVLWRQRGMPAVSPLGTCASDFYIRRQTRPSSCTRHPVSTLSPHLRELFMYKSKMATSLRRIFLLATAVSVVFFAVSCNADDQPGGAGEPGGQDAAGGGSHSLPEASALSTRDALNQPVSGGLISIFMKPIWPVLLLVLNIINFLLKFVAGQQLPCTVWRLVPPVLECKPITPTLENK